MVMRSVGSSYRVKLSSGEIIQASIRGKMRLQELKTTNPVAVGDQVELYHEPGEDEYVIDAVQPRHNFIARKAVKLSSQVQILCANVDQAVLIVTLKKPFTSLGYIDRITVMCEAYHVPIKLIFNKIDLLTQEKELNKLDDYCFIYEQAGYPILQVSALAPNHKDDVTALLADKTSFLVGPSGSGKSTLVNLVDPSLNLRTSAISSSTDKGRHTTTFAEMHPLAFGGYVIDAPGFREFDLVNIEAVELGGYFPEMRRLMMGCKFNNCLHTHEPGCAVRAAYEAETLADTRYHTYVGMLEGLLHPERK
jgi:ribosome biogenesis GTPase / thiamine phosphate phosphatase